MALIQVMFCLYFGGPMTNPSSNSPTAASTVTTPTAADTKQIVLKEIGARWSKFSEHDVAG